MKATYTTYKMTGLMLGVAAMSAAVAPAFAQTGGASNVSSTSPVDNMAAGRSMKDSMGVDAPRRDMPASMNPRNTERTPKGTDLTKSGNTIGNNDSAMGGATAKDVTGQPARR